MHLYVVFRVYIIYNLYVLDKERVMRTLTIIKSLKYLCELIAVVAEWTTTTLWTSPYRVTECFSSFVLHLEHFEIMKCADKVCQWIELNECEWMNCSAVFEWVSEEEIWTHSLKAEAIWRVEERRTRRTSSFSTHFEIIRNNKTQYLKCKKQKTNEDDSRGMNEWKSIA